MNISVKEFTPSLMNKDDSSISANCHVVINNNSTIPSNDSSINENNNFTNSGVSTNRDIGYPNVSSEILNPELSDHLAVCFSKILKSNNPDLIANVIDSSGKVIIGIKGLAKAIALITHKDYDDVRISYVENDVSCCSKINPIHTIAKIKIGTQDFNLNWNNEYNILEDKYNISLTRTLIYEGITY